MERYPAEPAYLLAALEDVQAAEGWVSESVARDLAHAFGAAPAVLASLLEMQGVFRTSPPAVRRIAVCTGPVCWQHGVEKLLEGLRQAAAGSEIRVEAVHCQGGCDHPPVAVCDGIRVTDATVERVWQAVESADAAHPERES